MASQGSNNNSRLAQVQMRFQQKQQQEREQRRIEMTSTSKLSTDESQSLGSSFGRGKVRQMFEQRRGVDKSYPLKPISTTSPKTTTTKRSTSGGAAIPTSTITKKPINSINTRNSLNNNRLASTVTNITFDMNAKNTRTVSNNNNNITNNNNVTNGNPKNSINNNKTNRVDNKTDLFGEENSDSLDDTDGFLVNDSEESEFKVSSKLPNVGNLSLEDSIDNNNDERTKKMNTNIKLKPVITRKTPTIVNQGGTGDSKLVKSPKDLMMKPAIPQNSESSNVKSVNKAERNNVLQSSAPPPPGMVSCKVCQRNFNADRIDKHQEICQKSVTKKRKTFDAAVHRVKGTEAERYVKRPSPKTRASKPLTKTTSPEQITNKKSNWRKKHEEFIQAIRAAKQVQEYVAKGGKLSDLPPPPPSENADYVQCPHCSRRFNEGAANRHIPKCATMLHNKPKPNAPPKKRY